MTRLLILLLAMAPAIPAAAAELPNVLLILSDDQSVPHMGCYGDPNVKTPRFDQFASQSIRFNRAYTTAPQCAPSRKSIMTGRSPVGLQQTLFTLPLQADAILFPELMKSQSDYFIGLVGRSHHLDGDSNPVVDEIANRYHLRTTQERFDICQVATGTNGNTRAITSIEQYKAFLNAVPPDKPFFLQLGFSDPHRPWDADFHPVYHDPKALKLPPYYPDTPQLRKDLAGYYDEVARLDYYFGLAVDELASRNLAQNTIVIFMGDNGSATLRGKGTLYENGLNVPLLIRWPGVCAPSVSNALISGEDIAPTVLDATGVPIPADMTGLSFLPLLKGQPFKPQSYVFAERGAHIGLPYNSASFDLSRTIIGERFKLIYNAIPSIPYTPVDFTDSSAWRSIALEDSKGKLTPLFKRLYRSPTRPVFEMYDLVKDPSELVNLAQNRDFQDIRYDLQKRLVEWMMLEKDYLPLPVPTVK